MQRIGILTSGGDGPGMNAAIRAVVRTATTHGVGVIAYIDGYMGLVEGRTRPLDDRAVGSQIQRGGTFIGTSRCPAFQTVDGRARAAAQLQADGVDGLVVVGGDGSFRGALALWEEHGVRVVGLPGTIDNDVWGTDETIGFDTAVNTAVEAIDRIRDTSEATGMMFFVEVMGRSSGALTMHTALAAGAAGVLVPEERHEVESLIQRIRNSIAHGKRSHIIVVAEGDDAGGAFGAAEKIGKVLNHEYRVVILGHVQRGGNPTARDRIISSLMGARAVDALVAGRTGMMVGMWGGVAIEVPLVDVVANRHGQPPLEILHLAQQLAG
jgi:6-phosphofructokinase 1